MPVLSVQKIANDSRSVRLCRVGFYVSEASAAEATENEVDIGVEGHGTHSKNSLQSSLDGLPESTRGGQGAIKQKPPMRLVFCTGGLFALGVTSDAGPTGMGDTSQSINTTLTLSPETTRPPATTVRQSGRLGSEGN